MGITYSGGAVYSDALTLYAPFTCPPTTALGDVVYVSGADSVAPASASGAGTYGHLYVVVAKLSPTSAVCAPPGRVLPIFTGLVPGATYYLCDAPGKVAPARPVAPAVAQVVGLARNATTLIFSPDRTFVRLAT